ncbi:MULTISPECIES: PhnD/SsuA/transferrin family substrate-binding protein [unclassified Roseitalea]|uniref:phosphate/phosphite/phosphonate ABC transporter substrate-binding protein n=1 Tax=unclassified Roseitalea TaxID=2639107 RepID=UPI00273F3220|nr:MULTISPECIES: PhnD/SsuA/transferrin family substrate-binding protein [unclassified Roseitalea]
MTVMNTGHRLGVLAAAFFLLVPAHGAVAQETGAREVFRVGIVADPQAGTQSPRYEPFRKAVTAASGMPTEIDVMRNGAALIDAKISGRIDYAVLSSLGYAAAQIACNCLAPLAAPTSAEGARGVRSVLVADGDKITGIDDLAETGLTFGPAGSLTGDLVPSASFSFEGNALRRAGLALERAASFEAARDRFLAGEIAAFFAWDYADPDGETSFENGLAARLSGDPQVGARTLWTSPVVPFGPHVVSADMPDVMRARLTAMLVALRDDDPDAFDAIAPALGGGFVAVTEDDYAYASEIVRSLAGRQ